MEPFRRLAFFTVARDAGYVALAAATLMVAFSFAPRLAFGIGAATSLIFSVGLIERAARLSDERITRTEAWRGLDPLLRPDGEPGRQWARENLEELLLRFAKGASAIAIALAASSLVLSIP